MLKKKIGYLAIGVILSGIIITGCSSNKEDNLENAKTTNITVVGSSALQPLADSAAKQFQKENENININVQEGGSGQGLSQISLGTVDVGNSDVFAEEKNIDTLNIIDNKVCIVGMGPVVNKEVGVSNITDKQLIDIFTGKIKNWKVLGGKDQEIIVINRASGSGTRATFEKWGLNEAQPIKSQEQDNSGSVKKIVAQTPGAISYLAFSYFDDSITALKLNGIEPNAENIQTNKWKIWAYEHMYIQKDASKETKAYINYVKEDAVQKNIVPKLGYISVQNMKIERNAKGEISDVE